ncbi:hypothetical protein WM34_02610 [Burkholderia ubonensis]|uniref:hypothetical protein n=1 Tax=Burkholderia ubonensis TaxID=101571 RepID=UPI00075E4F27|nr:hypothetical protein [Burkholderia ubonensis]KVO03683.1 hypothetical protein WJ69_26800 [Burkholderia ubonensis]KVO09910.1 hypothetical protein WJ73_22020 [Burkholderia ubonensis]KVO40177.1 hypothetical protein WJ76_07210 [Burkholderia ubonensis]KVP31625.1 hypothetical protein WJ85_28050 [Burkholderia ubonensis]KWD19576.1 hypothetical protein WL60_07125 [Burkholderia ubonensis]
MNPSPFVPVEGDLAVPRFRPLDGIPLGREWTFRGTSDARSGSAYTARTETTCIDVDAPHRACHWTPSSNAKPEPVVVHPRSHPDAAAPARRAVLASCWTLGALGIIGWLIAAHEPAFDPARARGNTQTGVTAISRIAQPPEPALAAARVPATEPSVHAAPETAAARPVITADAAPMTAKAEHPVVTHAAALPRTRRASERQATARAQPAMPAAHHRVAARVQPAPPPAAASALRRASMSVPLDDLDNPRTLIALEKALRTEQPAAVRAPQTAAADGDWTSRLSHRRLTDTPDAFMH